MIIPVLAVPSGTKRYLIVDLIVHLIVDLIFCPITSDFRANLDFFAKKSDLIVDLIVHLIVDLILSHLALPTPVSGQHHVPPPRGDGPAPPPPSCSVAPS